MGQSTSLTINAEDLCLKLEECLPSKAHLPKYVHVLVLYSSIECCMLTQPFLPQASRQFDQEGRKKFFTLDMNNILLE